MRETRANRQFPIPMRGNELQHDQAGRAARRRFPIPMRGNERSNSRNEAYIAVKFPIPMRGNEGGYRKRADGADTVSDPHEG